MIEKTNRTEPIGYLISFLNERDVRRDGFKLTSADIKDAPKEAVDHIAASVARLTGAKRDVFLRRFAKHERRKVFWTDV